MHKWYTDTWVAHLYLGNCESQTRRKHYPVAFDAKAELLDKRALISMMQYSRDVGCKAYWMLHSPTMPKCLTTWKKSRTKCCYVGYFSNPEKISYFLSTASLSQPSPSVPLLMVAHFPFLLAFIFKWIKRKILSPLHPSCFLHKHDVINLSF